MHIARITDRYSVAPQIEAGDAAAIREAGFTDVICNRPDDEVPEALSADAIRAAIEAEGLRFHLNPVRNGALGEEEVARQSAATDAAGGAVLAYCRSGTRSAVVWALGQTGDPDATIAAAARAGYDIAGLRAQLAARRGDGA